MKGLQILAIFSVIVIFAAADGGRTSSLELYQSRCYGRDGVFLPIPESCTQYIICVNGVAVLSSCGVYHFDARRGVCDLPGKAGCISFGPEPLPSQSLPVEMVCRGQKDNTKVPVPGSSSKFYLCIQEKAYLQNCGSLQFDEITMQCINVNPEPVPKPLVAPCSGVADGVRLPVPGNPRQYYFCMKNKYFIKHCGDMYFDPKNSACAIIPDKEPPKLASPVIIPPHLDRPLISPDPQRPIPPPHLDRPLTLPAQERPVQYDPMAQRMCEGQRLGARVALPGSCSEYYICLGNTGLLKSCGRMQFNPITMSCDVPSNVRCSVHQSALVYGEQDSVKAPTSENSTSADICYGQRDGIFVAAPEKCSDFYFCFKNRGYRKTCGDLHFSPITLSCVDLVISNCVDPAPVVQPQPTVEANVCFNQGNGVLIKHPTECGKFLICDNHVAVTMECPAGLHFNLVRNYCDWPEMAGCL